MMSKQHRALLGFIAAAVMACATEEEGPDGAITSLTSLGSSAGSETKDGGSDEGSGDTNVSGDGSATSDSGPSSTTGPADSGPATSDGSMTTGPADDGGVATTTGADPTADDGGGDPALQMCLDMAMNTCEDCACMNCLSQLQACQQDPGCIEIRMCAQQYGCTGIECLGPCGDVIDANGGAFGPSAGLASALSDCVEASCQAC